MSDTERTAAPTDATTSHRSPSADVHRRLTLAILFTAAAYAAAVAALHVLALQLAGRRAELDPMRVTELFSSMRLHGIAAVATATSALVVRRRRRCRPAAPKFALLAVMLILLISIDRIAGVWFPPPSELDSILEPHPTRGWAHRRGIVGSGGGQAVSINSLGLRGHEIPRSAKPDEFRILFLGDSLTFGYRLAIEETFVDRIRDALQRAAPTRTITAINAGVGGYSTWQEFEYLRNEGVDLRPDLVVLEYCFNDVIERAHFDPDKISGGAMRFSFSNVPHWSGLVRAIRSASAKRRYRTTLDAFQLAHNKPLEGPEEELRPIEDMHRDDPPPAVAAAWEQAIADLTTIHDFCREQGLPWVLVAFPFRSQLAPGPRIMPQERLRQWAEDNGAHLLDLLPAFHRHLAENGLAPADLFFDHTHLSVAGNRVAADRIVEYLRDNGLMP